MVRVKWDGRDRLGCPSTGYWSYIEHDGSQVVEDLHVEKTEETSKEGRENKRSISRGA